MKCEPKFVLTLKQARGLWGCLGNWLPVQWMGKWAWSQQGFVGRWERRQAIGTQHMLHGGSMLMLWERCWTSSWNLRWVTQDTQPRCRGVPQLDRWTHCGLWTHWDQGRTARQRILFFSCWSNLVCSQRVLKMSHQACHVLLIDLRLLLRLVIYSLIELQKTNIQFD